MLLQYDGLDNIGDEDDDYLDAKGMELDSCSENDDQDVPQDDVDEEVKDTCWICREKVPPMGSPQVRIRKRKLTMDGNSKGMPTRYKGGS